MAKITPKKSVWRTVVAAAAAPSSGFVIPILMLLVERWIIFSVRSYVNFLFASLYLRHKFAYESVQLDKV